MRDKLNVSEEKLYQLLRAYFSNTISSDDCSMLLKFLADADDEKTSLAIDDVLSELNKGVVYTEEQSKTVYGKILSDSRFKKRTNKRIIHISYRWLRYTALFILFSASALYFAKNYYSQKVIEQMDKITAVKMPVSDSNQVTLSTSNGLSVVLDSVQAQNGVIDIEGNRISKTGDKSLAYESKNSWMAKEAIFHTLSVPRGTTYRVQLPDGTNVWLNSATSLTYPSEFLGKERKVVLSGEAYFEVAKNQQKPFVIEANDNFIQVLGTHFNVSAYKDDEAVTTTLLEGSVKVFNQHQTKFLTPGKQAIAKINQAIIDIKQVNTEEVMAWKNGYFVFVDADIKSIMKELARWYNIDVEYKGDIHQQQIGGTFSKYKKLEELLEYLQTLGEVNFKLVPADAPGKGRRIIVMP